MSTHRTNHEDDFPTSPGHSIPAAPLDVLEELVLRLERAVASAELLLGHALKLTERVGAVERRVEALESRAAE